MRRAFAVFCSIAEIGAIMFIAFLLIGSDVDEDGFLSEPFALLPTGLFLLALGIIGAIASFAVAGRR